MAHIKGENRNQIKMISLDEMVDEKHIVRVIDRLVDSLSLEELGFTNTIPATLGRPSYDPAHLAKLYVFGYCSGVRSSRKLEMLCKENLPAMWLLGGLVPDFKTIADFRRDNIEAFIRLFEKFVSFCEQAGLLGKTLVAIDGTKVKASNNKKNNFSKKKIEKRLAYNRAQAEQYLSALDEEDDKEVREKVQVALEETKEKVRRYEKYSAALESAGEGELSTVDPDARLMGNNRGGVEVAYNVQASVDGENHIVVAADVINNPADQGQLAPMAKKTQVALGQKKLSVLADKGYYRAEDLKQCEQDEVRAIVARQTRPNEKNKDRRFCGENFTYDDTSDAYTCPMGHTLCAHSKKTSKRRKFFNKQACKQCSERSLCLTERSDYRIIDRTKDSEVYERADKLYRDNRELYRKRQQIVEHVFGTMKRTMNGGYLLLRTLPKVRGEVALLFLGYNLKRVLCCRGFETTMKLLG